MRIDTHQHFWAFNDVDYVWMEEEHAPLKRDFLPPDLQPLLQASGLDGCVAVQARQMLVETEWLLGLAEEHDWIKAVVGWVPLRENAGEPHLEKYGHHQKLAGVRHVIHDEPDDDYILLADFNEGIRRLASYGLVYDVLIFGKHLPQTIAFADRHPGQPLVIDHIAKPRIQSGRFDETWASGIRELARRENVSCKISGMVTEVRDDHWNVELLRPYFETVVEAFGASRVMYGSDWPVCLVRAEYREWARIAEELTAPLSEDERAAFWGSNATRIYGL
jgi:L-fuconolactonase